MTYIDVFHDVKKNIMLVSENKDGKTVTKQYPPSLFFYYSDNNGKHISPNDIKCTKFSTNSFKEYKENIETLRRSGRTLFESDVKPTFKTLEHYYSNNDLPQLKTAFLDIETDFCKERGFSSPEDAFMPITAVSVKHAWNDVLYTVVIKPNTITTEEAQEIVSCFSNTVLCDGEEQLLLMVIELIKDCNIISGWNSEGYDIPYIVHRIKKVLGEEYTNELCMWNQPPKQRTYTRYKEECITYDLIGRQHLDYLQLYRKFTYHELQSYRLDFVGEIEVNERKIQYDGSLDALYNNDFKKFIEYNRQDTDLLYKIDKKLKYIDLVNLIAHENLVPLQTVMGSVALSDNAILLEAHKRGFVIEEKERTFLNDKDNDEDDDDINEDKIAGAFVKDPVPGIYEWIGSVDINSLYPSAFRALNMSPETIIGHIEQTQTKKLFEEKIKEFREKSSKKISNAWLWAGMFEIPEVKEVQNKTDTELQLHYEDGISINISAKELWHKIIKNNWLISANGVIFRTDKEGIVPGLLSRWYNDRQDYQKELKQWTQLKSGIDLSDDLLNELQTIN